MATCDVCGNNYDKAFQVIRSGESFTFDSIECAASRIAPTCEHCNCRILGHGLESEGAIFCCANCARESGKTGLRDRVEAETRQSA